ncbi:hypothetical protein PF005_g1283 [Phytophthora fragariae]|uniref:TNFR-Cys domain-containing protein n=2 Tax=Phytophthora TaxID=4783 RepID=A0A6A3MEP3_9STRA|nr:hypothetical protein PF003_g4209 [Phytophthora fragariae]KAE9048026.1 hypothetical protein PR002_g711 [Phytophthora rubi]KAE8949134.1 hypothetical protein PF009_g1305 [Phytophthora fragariae]KAE9030042.1 hypothetical protein PF011_g777 [Phytophthora fragariae]KAE9052116.1 hypothetical protein PR001_g821 [Phytophthora rubi]
MRAIHLSSAFLLVLATINFGTGRVAATSCADRVSSGDQQLGITAVEDAACAAGGLGCFPEGDQCRFCRPSNASDTENSHLMLCSQVQVSVVSSSESTMSKSTTTTTTDSLEAAIDCLSLVSVGDQGVGISAVAATSPTCASNGLGCFQDGKCRFCQSRQTTQSAPYMKCSLAGGSSTTTSTPSTATSSPAYTPAPTAASTSTSCSSVVSRSALQGISYISDSRCNVAAPTLLGCSARTSCRLCRDYKNEANQYLMSCQVLKDLGTTESAAAAPTESVEAADQTSGKLTVTTEAAAVEAATTADATLGVIGAVAAVVAVMVVVMMSVMYVKGKRDPLDEIMTPDDCPDGDLMTPHGGRGYTPREGSLVMVVSQSSIATL